MVCTLRGVVGKWFLNLVALSLVLSGGAVSVRSQETEPSKPVRGLYPAGAYDLGGIETIDTTSGNLRLNIPLASLPAGRGGGFTLRLHYNSKLYDAHVEEERQPNGSVFRLRMLEPSDHSGEGGWRYGLRYQMHLERQAARCGQPGGTDVYKLYLVFPDGNLREFRPAGYDDYSNKGFFPISPGGEQPCGGGTVPGPRTYYSTDGSYLRLVFPNDGGNSWTLYFPDGSTVKGGATQRHTDRNGNYTDVYSLPPLPNGNNADRVTDQWGRSLTVEYDTAANRDYVYTTGFGGAEELRWTVKWGTTYANRTYDALWGCSRSYAKALRAGHRVVTQLDLPQQAGGLPLQFGYNGKSSLGSYPDPVESVGMGELSEVTLPTGARVKYHYFHDKDQELPAWGAPCWRQVLKNYPVEKELIYRPEHELAGPPPNTACDPATESCAVESWQYDMGHTFSTQRTQTTITDPKGGVTLERYYDSDGGSDYFPTRSWRSGLVYRVERPDGAVVERDWEGNKPALVEPDFPSIQMNPYVRAEYTSVPNADRTALVKTATKVYTRDKNGNVLKVAEYDWVPYGTPRDAQGVPQGAALLRETVNEYYNPTTEASDGAYTPNSYHQETWLKLWNVVKSTEVRSEGGQTEARTEYAYDDPTNTGNLKQVTSWDSHAGGVYRPLTRPLQPDNSVSVKHDFDPARKNLLIRTTDARGVKTEFFYDSVNGHDDLYPTRTVVATGTSVQRTTRSEYDFSSGAVTRVTDVDNNASTATDYDALGRAKLVKAAVDLPEEVRTFTTYFDAERRTVVRSDLDTLTDGRLVQIRHYDQLGRIRLTRQLEGGAITPEVLADESIGIKVQTRYVNTKTACAEGVVGGYVLTSNPYRAATVSAAGAETTTGWTLTKFDSAGRAFETETVSGAAAPSPCVGNGGSTGRMTTAYDAETATVTDQAEKQRRNVSDALGRLVQVVEAPNAPDYNYQTSYTYDALGNLTQVEQGEQTRTFTYSSLSRLVSAVNPEVCRQAQAQCTPVPAAYEYDEAGNLKKKTDARLLPGTQTHVQVTYDYDELNRIKARTYNDDTPDVAYFYDSQPLPAGAPVSARGYSAGRLTAVTYGGGQLGNYAGGYDALGRVKLSRQVTDTGTAEGAKTYEMSYDYHIDGRLKSEKYPSGKIIETKYDAAGRVAGVQKQATGLYYVGATSNSADSIKYGAHGAVVEMKLGNGLWEHTNFNSRFQPTEIGLGSSRTDSSMLRLEYGYGLLVNGTPDPTKNNGNVRIQGISVPAEAEAPARTFTQSYTYDALNRLETAEETNGGATNWKQAYTYDRYGNRNFAAETTYPNYSQSLTDPVGNPVVDTANNRIKSSAAGHGNYLYDAAGNLTRMPVTAQAHHDLAYDAENRQVKSDGGAAAGGADYVYDGEGRRVKKVVGAVATVFVYDIMSRLVAEYSNQVGTNGTRYMTQDHLGSTRVVTDAMGNAHSSGVARGSRHDYLPFGEELYAGTDARPPAQWYGAAYNARQRFTGYERDQETTLDYARARYYSAGQGRFTGVDPLSASARPARAQSWNRYAYVLNNPLRLVDPNGLQDTEPQRRTNAQITLAPPPVSITGPTSVRIVEQGFVAETNQPTRTESWAAAIGFSLSLPSVFSYTSGTAVGSMAAPALIGGLMATGSFTMVGVANQGGPYTDMANGWATNGGFAAGQAIMGNLSSQNRPTPFPLPLPVPYADNPPGGGGTVTYYHYTTSGPESFVSGLWSGSSATTRPDLHSMQASQGLGIIPPTLVYPVTIDPRVTPVTPVSIVGSSNRYAGGLPEVFFPQGTPPGSVGPPRQVPP